MQRNNQHKYVLIAKDMMHLSTVERQLFKELMSVMDAKCALPWQKHFSRTSSSNTPSAVLSL